MPITNDINSNITILKLLSFAEEDIENRNLHDEDELFLLVEELLNS